jgi:hypothetical protein
MNGLTGKCHCGKNTFKLASDPEFQFVCHCKNCRVLNSGGHLCGMMFDEDKFQATNETASYTYNGGSGEPIILHFCPDCGTHLYAYPTHYKGKVVIRANTLDNADFTAQQSIFTESAFPWDKDAV